MVLLDWVVGSKSCVDFEHLRLDLERRMLLRLYVQLNFGWKGWKFERRDCRDWGCFGFER